MKFTLNWLKEYLDTDKQLSDILDGLLSIGLEVESVRDYQEELKAFSVAEILTAEQHPNADKLQVCEVKTSEGIKQIVCGASNARAGIKVIYAKEGTYIKGLDVTLKKAEIRGVESIGMMLSEKELDLSDAHAGIVEVDNKYQVGEAAAVALEINDVVIDVAITANVAYLLSIKNIAKDLAALGLGKFKTKQYDDFNIQNNNNITINASDKIVNRFVVAEFNNINNIASPKWLQSRLNMVGQKPISALVDITNYVMYELNHPMHVYDKDKIGSDLTITFGEVKDTMEGLNNNIYSSLSSIPVIKSNEQVVALAGILGSKNHSVDNNTKNVILECAGFIKEEVFKSNKILKVHTDSSYRFERNVNPNSINEAISLAKKLILQICGGELTATGEINNFNSRPLKVEVTTAFINDLLGINLTTSTIIDYLTKLEFKVTEQDNSNLLIEVPNYRTDIENEYGIAEVIVKMYGINNVKPLLLAKDNYAANSLTPQFEQALLAKRSLAKSGLYEAVNMSFISEKLSNLFQVFNNELVLSNPISTELAVMRGSLIPALTHNVVNNVNKGFSNLALFEVGNIFSSLEEDGQKSSAAGIFYGLKEYKNWQNKDISYDVFDAKAKLFNLIEDLGLNPEKLIITKESLPHYYHPSKSGTVWIGKNPIAYFGEMHPLIAQDIGLKKTAIIFEVMLNNLPFSKKSNNVSIQELSNFMPFTRDFAFLFDKNIKASEVIKLVSAVDKQLIKEVRIFDVYEGDKLEENQKSIAFSVLFEPFIKTLNELEITEVGNKIIDTITNKLGGKLRNL
ncbi:phenylalanine--tRNA ligase subunit beta [Rickettsiales bacterium LUAb2]